jgi:ubiquinone/menaquinone biosynthesis C-methylase UbiE
MDINIAQQKEAFEEIYKSENMDRFAFHVTPERLVRYLRDRRLNIALDYLQSQCREDITDWKVLTVCGGVGGEGIFFLRAGFADVTVSDFSANSLEIAAKLDNKLKAVQLNAEKIDLSDNSYDLVIVQDGLHHLPRPSLGLTEMLRVAKRAIVVIEPYNSVVGNLIGTEWEEHDGAVNYVYRWDREMVEQTVKSYLLRNYSRIRVFRRWDHNVVVGRLAGLFPRPIRTSIARIIYSLLRPFSFTGNMMIGVVLKKSS